MPDGVSESQAIGYLPRVIDAEVRECLRGLPAVLIEGPRACGKTSTGRQHSSSEVMFGADATARSAAEVDPRRLLRGPRPRLLDEWQLVPSIWNQVRAAADEAGSAGSFILTGSATPADDLTRHTGTGRITRVQMRPMSLHESGISSGEIGMRELFAASTDSAAAAEADLGDLIDALCRGGWPACHTMELAAAQRYCLGYINEVSRADVAQLAGERRNPTGVMRLIRSLARNVASEASERTLASDTGGQVPLHRTTVANYLDCLRRLLVVEELPAWTADLRSRARLRQSPKRLFTDPSLAVAALRANPARLDADHALLGLLFEALVVRDVRVYAQAQGGELHHYRDSTGLEVDIIIERGDGRWIAMEVKLGASAAIDDAAAALLKLRDRVDTTVLGPPSNLVVVTATGYGYRRSDGVLVMPLTALGP